MLAGKRQVVALQMGILARGAVEAVGPLDDDTVPEHSHGHIIFHLAGVRTGLATHAPARVDR